MSNFETTVLGYTETSDGRYISIAQPAGAVYTQAFITCRECDQRISNVGGPAWKSICVECYDKLESKNKENCENI